MTAGPVLLFSKCLYMANYELHYVERVLSIFEYSKTEFISQSVSHVLKTRALFRNPNKDMLL